MYFITAHILQAVIIIRQALYKFTVHEIHLFND